MADIGRVVRALRSLYNSGSGRSRLADIVHDADFLSKSGYLGVANFFVKSTLRGRNLESAAMDFLSRELTYAAVLPANMRTAAARRLAVRKSADGLRFYRSYLAELNEAHGLDAPRPHGRRSPRRCADPQGQGLARHARVVRGVRRQVGVRPADRQGPQVREARSFLPLCRLRRGANGIVLPARIGLTGRADAQIIP